MRIGVIATMKKGLEQFVYRELRFLTTEGFSISLFPTKYNRGLYNPLPEWRLHRWNILLVLLSQPSYFFRAPWRYLTLLREAIRYRAIVDFLLGWHAAQQMKDVDIIYSTFGDHKLFIGYFCKRILNKPLVVTIHAYELYANPNPRMFVPALQACDQIITVTDYNREYLDHEYHINPSNIEVVRCGVDIDDYRPAKKFVILIVSFFVERKGHDILFKAIQKLGRDDIEVWVVGGEGTEESTAVDVQGLAKQLGIEEHVAFFGKQSGNALKAMYRACDVFCLPCRKDSEGVSEGFPVVIIEAMAMGKAVITTRHVEIPRIVQEIVVDENDIDGLANAIMQAYESEELRHRLGEKNRAIAEQLFSSRNALKTARIMRQLIEHAHGRPRPISASTIHTDRVQQTRKP